MEWGECERAVCWSKPLSGLFKCNVDGAIFEASGRIGHGFILRDGSGKMICVMSGSLKWMI